MSAIFNSFVTSKIENREFARKILELRRSLENEMDRLINYKTIGVWTTDKLMKETELSVKKHDREFFNIFNALPFVDKIKMIATWNEFAELAEEGRFQDSEILLSAARIVK